MRRLTIKVVPGARQNALKEEKGAIKVYLTAPPVDGRANEALIKFLSRHFDVRPGRIQITHGHMSRTKTVVIDAS